MRLIDRGDPTHHSASILVCACQYVEGWGLVADCLIELVDYVHSNGVRSRRVLMMLIKCFLE